jgi:hypothetical protein
LENPSIQGRCTSSRKRFVGIKCDCTKDTPGVCKLEEELYKSTKQAFEGFGDFKIGGQLLRTVKYADDFVLLATAETLLCGVADRLIEIGRYYGMEMNVEKIR